MNLIYYLIIALSIFNIIQIIKIILNEIRFRKKIRAFKSFHNLKK
jgi:hypothetical protein